MKDKGKTQKKSLVKIINNKENIKTQEIEKKKTVPLEQQISKKITSLQSSIRHRKRKQTIKLQTKVQELKKITNKIKRKKDDGYLRPAHSVQLRKNRFNIEMQQSKALSLSANKKLRRSIESVREIVRKFNKTIQQTPSSFGNDVITHSFQQRKITMPIEIYQTLNISKKKKSKPNTRRNSHSKPESFSKQYLKPKKTLTKKKGSVDLGWPRSLLQDRMSDVVRLQTSEDKGSIIQSTQIQLAILTENDDFNLQELRQLEFKAKLINKKKRKQSDGQSSNSYFNIMASKIQRFWRQYKTKKILSRHITPCQSHNNTIQIPYESMQLYGNSVPQRHNTYVSHLQSSEQSSKMTGSEMYESVIKNIKNQQLQKWDQLIQMVEQSIKDKTGTQQLLKKLIEQSQINRLNLEQNTENLLANSSKTTSFKQSPQINKKYQYSSLEKSLNFCNEQSPYSQGKLIQSPAQIRPIQPQLIDRPSNKIQKLFNYKGIQKFKQSINMKSQQQQDSFEVRIAVEKLKQKLVELNDHSAQRIGFYFQQQDSPHLKRDKRSLDREDEISLESSSSEDILSQQQRDQINPMSNLIQLITKNIDKQVARDQITAHIIMHQMQLLLKDMAVSSKLYRQLKSHIKKPILKVKGMRSNLAAVKQYLKSLGDFVFNLQGEPLKGLQNPSGPTTMEMLKYMRFYDEQQDDENDGDDQIILSSNIFDYHWAQYSSKLNFPKSYESQQSQQNHQDFLKRLTNIHCRALFDTLNQSLDLMRNYGQFGKPFPWKQVPNFFHQFKINDQKTALQLGIQKTIQVASNFCGLILDKQQYGGSQLPSTEYIQQMHEQRLSRTLAQQVVESQQKWLFYDDEQTQILIEIAYSVNQQLIQQIAQFLLQHYI